MPASNATKPLPLDTAPDRVIPVDLAAEAMTLSAMLLSASAAGNVFEIIGERVACFTDDRHSALYRVMLALFNANKPTDDATLILAQAKTMGCCDRLNAEFLLELVNTAPTDAHAEYHAMLLVENEQKRRLIASLEKSLADCYEPSDSKTLTDRVEARIFEAANRPNSENSVATLAEMIQTMLDTGAAKPGLKTGITELDAMTLGMHAGELSILAARPSVGKTALALGIVEYIAVQQRRPTALFSLEMRQAPIMQRMLSARSGVPLQNIRRNMFQLGDQQKMDAAIAELAQGDFFLDDASSLTLFDLRAKCRRLKKKHGIATCSSWTAARKRKIGSRKSPASAAASNAWPANWMPTFFASVS
jgi:replicative DNA helicase